MSRAKLVSIVLLTALVVTVVFQNTETVSVRVLFFTVSTTRALLILAAFLCGVAVGLFGRFWPRRRSKPAKAGGVRG